MPCKIIPPSRLKMIGTTIGKTIIVGFEYVTLKNNLHPRLRARQRCECGKEILSPPTLLSKYCKNCYKGFRTIPATTHGQARTAEWTSWSAMKGRCYNKNNPAYHNYGGRGIIVCDRWLDKKDGFINFLKDIGERPAPKHLYSIDRINNEGNYEPGNCKWSTKAEQVNNQRKNTLIYDKICCVCDKNYTAKFNQLKRIYCSRTCQGRAYKSRLKSKQCLQEQHL